MRLSDYLERHKIKRGDFAATIGATPSRVTQLCEAEGDQPGNWPGRELMIRIREATNGEVTADDFLPAREEKVGEGAS